MFLYLSSGGFLFFVPNKAEMIKYASIILIVLLCCRETIAQGTTGGLSIDKKATPQTVHLYKSLKALLQQRIMFGHHDDLAYGVGWKYKESRSDAKDVTGNYPAVQG